MPDEILTPPEVSELPKVTKRTVIELFCGAGGTSYGFLEAGFDVRLGLDINQQATRTFSLNHPSAVALCDSVENVTGDQLLGHSGLASVDVLLGGPSCQGFSTMGPRIVDDPRNFLFKHYLRLVDELKPKWIVFENVKGMKFHGQGKFFKQLCQDLSALGYSINHAVLNAADFGIPQRRERLFVIGTTEGYQPQFPEKSHCDPRCIACSRPDASNRIRRKSASPSLMFGNLECSHCSGTGIEPDHYSGLPRWVSVWDAIGDLAEIGESGGTLETTPYSVPPFSAYQDVMRSGSEGYTLHKARPVSAYARSIIEMIAEGKGLRSIPENLLPDRFKTMRKVSGGSLRRDCTTLYHRLSRTLPSYTITCSFTNVASGAFAHPLDNRAITIREAARLQSFPDIFQFSDSGLKNQIGNAVPPLLARKLAEGILLPKVSTSCVKLPSPTPKARSLARPLEHEQVVRQGLLELPL